MKATPTKTTKQQRDAARIAEAKANGWSNVGFDPSGKLVGLPPWAHSPADLEAVPRRHRRRVAIFSSVEDARAGVREIRITAAPLTKIAADKGGVIARKIRPALIVKRARRSL